MKKIFAILCAVSALSFLHVTAREVTDLNFGWEFNAGDSIWRNVDLPHDFQIEQPWVAPDANESGNMGDQASNVKSRLSPRAFKEMGKGTYRRTITPDASIKGKRVLLDFEGIMLVGDVYLNGEHVGKTDYGYLGFEVDVTDKLKYGEPNELVVIADTGEPLSSRWYTGGGLYRGVKMVTQDPDLYIGRHGIYVTTPQISDEKATIVVQADVVQRSRDKELTVLLEITDPNGVTISRDTQTIPVNGKWRNREYTLAPVEIPTPALWDCEHPNMYTARVTLLHPDDTEADSAEVPFGIRSLEYSPEFGLKLNGKKVLLKGIANHHTLGALGAAA
ncbi:MAG: beta-galactosidase, partial [Muribaculaceae bacterium]|nr:beta-galactosidase [Muribaculaceae bacterium]